MRGADGKPARQAECLILKLDWVLVLQSAGLWEG